MDLAQASTWLVKAHLGICMSLQKRTVPAAGVAAIVLNTNDAMSEGTKSGASRV